MIQRIDADLKSAMLARDEVRVSTLRLLKAALANAEIANKSALDEPAIIATLQRELKQRLEAAESYDNASSTERAAKERQEAAIIEAYLPAKMSSDEINSLVSEAIAVTNASTVSDMGKVMAWLKPKTAGRADGAHLAGLVKDRLTSNQSPTDTDSK